MSPITHFLTSWVIANINGLNRKERAIVTIAGISPDIDSAGIIAEKMTKNWENPLLWWSKYHHIIAHNLGFCLLITIIAFVLATRKWKTAFLVFLGIHIHFLGDLIGARGPEGYQWPLPYLLPFSNSMQLTWQGQWALNAWQNFVITGLALFFTLFLAWKRGFSPLEMISNSADKAFVNTLRNRFPRNQI